LDNIPSQIKDDIMTTYSQIKLEGKLEGKIEGKLEGKIEGKIEGEQIGIQKGKIEVVYALNQDGIPLKQIAKYTNLAEEEVLEILKKKV
jgi:predicted transposase YdaD